MRAQQMEFGFRRDGAGRVVGFTLTSGRVREFSFSESSLEFRGPKSDYSHPEIGERRLQTGMRLPAEIGGCPPIIPPISDFPNNLKRNLLTEKRGSPLPRGATRDPDPIVRWKTASDSRERHSTCPERPGCACGSPCPCYC